MVPGDNEHDVAHVVQAALRCDSSLAVRVDFLPVSAVTQHASCCSARMPWADFPVPSQVYAAYLRELIVKAVNHPQHRSAPLTGLRIVVNAGNGSGGFMATQVLAPLGADISGVGSAVASGNGSFNLAKPRTQHERAGQELLSRGQHPLCCRQHFPGSGRHLPKPHAQPRGQESCGGYYAGSSAGTGRPGADV